MLPIERTEKPTLFTCRALCSTSIYEKLVNGCTGREVNSTAVWGSELTVCVSSVTLTKSLRPSFTRLPPCGEGGLLVAWNYHYSRTLKLLQHIAHHTWSNVLQALLITQSKQVLHIRNYQDSNGAKQYVPCPCNELQIVGRRIHRAFGLKVFDQL